MKLLGVEKVSIGRIQSTKNWKRPESEPFSLRTSPCCSYRCMSNFTIDGEGIYASYFDKGSSRIGNLATHIDELTANYQAWIEKSIPVLSDPNCSSCPVIAACWGQCRGSAVYRDRPSRYCDKPKLEKEMREACEHGKLFDWLKYTQRLKDVIQERIST